MLGQKMFGWIDKRSWQDTGLNDGWNYHCLVVNHSDYLATLANYRL